MIISKIKRITDSILDLPALPSIVSKIIELIDDPNTSADSLSKLIATDQAITAKILKIANSPFYAFPNEISSVKLAISLLGFDAVSNLVLSISFFHHFADKFADDEFNMSKFWEHNLLVALVAKSITDDDIKYREIFTMGILHDIGKLIIRQYLNNYYLEIHKHIVNYHIDSHIAEKHILGVSHAEIGSWLCEKWDFPQDIIDSLKFHHNCFDENSTIFAKLIAFSDELVNEAGYSYPEKSVLHKKSFDYKQLTEIDLLRKTTDKSTGIQSIDLDYYFELTNREIENAEEIISLLQTN